MFDKEPYLSKEGDRLSKQSQFPLDVCCGDVNGICSGLQEESSNLWTALSEQYRVATRSSYLILFCRTDPKGEACVHTFWLRGSADMLVFACNIQTGS